MNALNKNVTPNKLIINVGTKTHSVRNWRLNSVPNLFL